MPARVIYGPCTSTAVDKDGTKALCLIGIPRERIRREGKRSGDCGEVWFRARGGMSRGLAQLLSSVYPGPRVAHCPPVYCIPRTWAVLDWDNHVFLRQGAREGRGLDVLMGLIHSLKPIS